MLLQRLNSRSDTLYARARYKLAGVRARLLELIKMIVLLRQKRSGQRRGDK